MIKAPLQEYAYQECKVLIESGELSPGHLYSEVALAKQLGVSRTPMRTALQNLEKDGLIIRLPQRGFYVYQFTKQDILELFAIRKALEGFAVETIAHNKIAIDSKQLNMHMQRQKKALQSDNFSLFIQEDRQFHETLIQALNNKRLFAAYSDLRQSIELFGLQRLKISSQRNQSIEEHTVIIQEIEEGNPHSARNAVYRHLDSALELLLQNLPE